MVVTLTWEVGAVRVEWCGISEICIWPVRNEKFRTKRNRIFHFDVADNERNELNASKKNRESLGLNVHIELKILETNEKKRGKEEFKTKKALYHVPSAEATNVNHYVLTMSSFYS